MCDYIYEFSHTPKLECCAHLTSVSSSTMLLIFHQNVIVLMLHVNIGTDSSQDNDRGGSNFEKGPIGIL